MSPRSIRTNRGPVEAAAKRVAKVTKLHWRTLFNYRDKEASAVGPTAFGCRVVGDGLVRYVYALLGHGGGNFRERVRVVRPVKVRRGLDFRV